MKLLLLLAKRLSSVGETVYSKTDERGGLGRKGWTKKEASIWSDDEMSSGLN